MGNADINKQKSCMDDIDSESLPASAALQTIYSTIVPITDTEHLPIKEVLNRVLAQDIISSLNVPKSKNSAMDGYALNAADIPNNKKFVIAGKALAGKPYKNKISTNQCVRIMTGATMPENTDTVVIQEHVQRSADNISINTEIKQGANVRQAGEDIKTGDIVLPKSKRITPADIGLIASLGIGQVTVTRKPNVAFFSTGDELRSIGEHLQDSQIYDSNRYTLFGMLSELNVNAIDMGVCSDDREHLRQAFTQASYQSDIIITTGGVSVGEADFVKQVLQEIGTVNFWKIAIKPGRPLAFGNIQNTLFFGLPGNPVSVMVTFSQFIKPAIKHLMGEQHIKPLIIKVTCTSTLRKRPGRVEYQRGILEYNNACLVVRKTGDQGSGILSSMSQANCFIILPISSTSVEPGNIVEVQPFSSPFI